MNKNKLTAVVYDKWLTSFGGGEMVACNIAKILKDANYDVTFVCGKRVSMDLIKEKLNIDLTGTRMVEVWNDEEKLRKLSKGQDLFVNTTFMDYSFGSAKMNIYYTHFPTKVYENIKGLAFNSIILPLVSKFIKPAEFISDINSPTIINGAPAYPLRDSNRIAFSYLKVGEKYVLEFRLYLKNFYKGLLDFLKWDMEGGVIEKQEINVIHRRNEIHVSLQFLPRNATAYLNICFVKKNFPFVGKDEVYLLYPKILVRKMSFLTFSHLYDRASSRLRAGIFRNILQRLKTYKLIFSNSDFTKEWVKNYWRRSSKVLYPPVEMIFKKNKVEQSKKKNWICSVGRFFTLGHGKKQEVLIDAFMKLCDGGLMGWQLHLVGGIANDSASLRYVNTLKNLAAGYPIFFHFDVTREEVIETYLKSKIYWHAAGFGEDKNKQPVKFEHFGIAPIEAISAGCIPVLFNGGGLKEIVNIIGLSEDKHLFASIDQLVENTLTWIEQEIKETEWKKIFQLLDKNFSVNAFKKSFLDTIQNKFTN